MKKVMTSFKNSLIDFIDKYGTIICLVSMITSSISIAISARSLNIMQTQTILIILLVFFLAIIGGLCYHIYYLEKIKKINKKIIEIYESLIKNREEAINRLKKSLIKCRLALEKCRQDLK